MIGFPACVTNDVACARKTGSKESGKALEAPLAISLRRCVAVGTRLELRPKNMHMHEHAT